MAGHYSSQALEGRTPQAPIRRLGAWKLAYADFLTALCAFFIVMWMVSGASSEERADLARQFGAGKMEAVSVEPDQESTVSHVEALLTKSALFSDNSTNVTLTRFKDGLRIELIDLDQAPLFENGMENLNERGESLIALASGILKTIGRPISLEGHTDSQPVNRQDYSNWELSSGRANAARRGLIANGFPEYLIASVSGLSDTKPLRPDAPYLPQNRRLSIVVHIDERP